MNKYKDEQRGKKPVFNPMIHIVVFILYTKYALILYSCGDIFDEKGRKKKAWINIEKNK